MGFYSKVILPRLLDRAMGDKRLAPLRKELLAPLGGRVAELGFGTGTNLPFYPEAVSELVAIEPSPELLARATKRLKTFTPKFDARACTAEEANLEPRSFDYVVSTFTLCTVPSPMAFLSQVRRMLRPGGKFVFLEHGLAPDPGLQRWQRRLTPIQKKISGGCHLDRNILGLLADACCDVPTSRRFFLEKTPKVAGFVTLGEGEFL